ncbi:DNA polymerase epsilon catalytic subunit B [Schizosaccharomyces octosporus yFS286]|uniref:DNA polymerase epsilon subunit B n=1 Tax=Schizosaccharomyces octosporus (strain yFS286) TaxID=483514 RepID=S9PUE7_SCHOY|nr:DNA polymerase epsilon catalytic subunit B [Schizosaccharomyces octosporus yFS286]EPX71088.1 DNA polymerase epsilon catalytic subunit B [Schizosaccharomyces octosporus yFS286]
MEAVNKENKENVYGSNLVNPTALRPVAFHVFTRKYDLNINRDSLQELAAYVSKRCGSHWRSQCEPLLDEIAKTWKRTHDSEPIVTKPLLSSLLTNLTVPHEARTSSFSRTPTIDSTNSLLRSSSTQVRDTLREDDYFRVIDSFQLPKRIYDPNRKIFISSKTTPSLLAPASASVDMLHRRFHVIYSRILRNENFQNPSFSGSFSQTNSHQITPIRNLLGRSGDDFLLFGLLSLAPDGKLWLEDLDSQVQLDISKATFGFGHFCAGCFVLVNGHFMDSGVFLVTEVGHPPIERREASLKALSQVDSFGSQLDANQITLLRHAEQAYKAPFVFLSEVHLDDTRCLQALEKVFQKYEYAELLPACIVLCGSFTSTAFHNSGSSLDYKEGFNKLALIFAKFTNISKNCKIIFVPGPNDPWTTYGLSLMPKRAIPLHFVNRIQRICKNAIFSSNPCRISFFSQEIVIYREDITGRFQRHDLKACNDSSQSAQSDTLPLEEQQLYQNRKLVKTILDQSHLSPFHPRTRPVLWDFDYTLSTFPLPNCLAIVDSQVPAFNVHYGGCLTLNPGSLILGLHYNWQELHPVTKQVVSFQERL